MVTLFNYYRSSVLIQCFRYGEGDGWGEGRKKDEAAAVFRAGGGWHTKLTYRGFPLQLNKFQTKISLVS